MRRRAIVTDLPAGGRRLLQSATGYRCTIKRGSVTFEDGVATGRAARASCSAALKADST